jgi:hypothetical protein
VLLPLLLLLLLLLLQSAACLKRTVSGEEGCQKAPYCFWNPAEKICLRNTLEFEGMFDKRVQRLYVSDNPYVFCCWSIPHCGPRKQ